MTGDQTRVTHMGRKAAGHSEECCLVQIHGPQLGKKFLLAGPALCIGREEDNDIVVDLDTVSRHHARVSRRGSAVQVEDLDSTNGTFLNDRELHGGAALQSGDLIKVGGALFKFLEGDDVEVQYHETLYTLAISDGLTGASNKRYLLEYLEREMGRCHRYGRALSLMLFDIDHFKQVNDTHGHVAGDAVLRELAQSVMPLVRREQCFARYGGEEFALVLPEDGADKARHFAEKLRRQVETHPFTFDGRRIPVTVSVGVADLGPEMTDPLHLLEAADARLYAAKRGGRNRVEG
jgi:two-component system, cell cycle response regulator